MNVFKCYQQPDPDQKRVIRCLTVHKRALRQPVTRTYRRTLVGDWLFITSTILLYKISIKIYCITLSTESIVLALSYIFFQIFTRKLVQKGLGEPEIRIWGFPVHFWYWWRHVSTIVIVQDVHDHAYFHIVILRVVRATCSQKLEPTLSVCYVTIVGWELKGVSGIHVCHNWNNSVINSETLIDIFH